MVAAPSPIPPSPWVVRWTHLVRPGGSVLDVACGSGRHARWFADHGHVVTAVDRDVNAVAALPPNVAGVSADLERQRWPFHDLRYDALVVTNYLWRPLLPTLVHAIASGGVLIYETFADGQQQIGRPRNPSYLLSRGELLSAVRGLRVVAYEDGYESASDAHVQRVIAVRESSDGVAPPHYRL